MRDASAPTLGTPKEVAAYMRTTEGSLAQQRYKGRGPRFIKRGSRVVYRWSDIEEYLDQQTLTGTSGQSGAA